MEQEGDNGLGVLEHRGAPHYHMKCVLDLVQETQVGLHLDNLMVNENFPIVNHVLIYTLMDVENTYDFPRMA